MARPWDDARTYRREFEVRKITAQDVIESVEKLKELRLKSWQNHCDGYIFYTYWVRPYVSEEECIKYFADNGSVLVRDGKGNMWHKGRRIEDGKID